MSIDFNYELNMQNRLGYKCIAGVDEAGRGPLAGPVTAGAFVFNAELTAELIHEHKELKILRDSKLLSAQQRESLYGIFVKLREEGRADFATASVFPSTIDKKHIHHAVAIAMQRAVSKLSTGPDHAIVDGFRYPKKILTSVEYSSMFKADGRVPSVAAASIVAKVTRDKSMKRYHKKYPEYRFDLHKGYGTELHYKMLKKHGPSPIHRQSFRLT